MASNAVRAQVAAKWQESFNRLNRGEPGISGLLAFSEVRHLNCLHERAPTSRDAPRHGPWLQSF